MTAYQDYHPNFRHRRKQVEAEFGNHCARCGIANGAITYNKQGRITMVFLHKAHVSREEKMRPDAPLILLCPTCHWYFDHPRGDTPEGVADWAFIGKVERYFLDKEEEKLYAFSNTD